MQAEAMAAYTRSVLEPLVTALERSEARVAELERENGRQAAELERATAAIVTLGDELTAERAKSTLVASTATQGSEPSPVPLPLWRRSWAIYGVGIISVLALVIGLVALWR